MPDLNNSDCPIHTLSYMWLHHHSLHLLSRRLTISISDLSMISCVAHCVIMHLAASSAAVVNHIIQQVM